jgi:hypothetical protein
MPARQGYDPFRDTRRAQDFAREGVQAFGEQLRPELMREIGSTIGGLNEIGALRSGGTAIAMDDLTRTFADRIGTFASTATLGAMGHGMEAGRQRLANRDLNFREAEGRRNRRAALLRSIGSVLGAGIGFAVAGG